MARLDPLHFDQQIAIASGDWWTKCERVLHLQVARARAHRFTQGVVDSVGLGLDGLALQSVVQVGSTVLGAV